MQRRRQPRAPLPQPGHHTIDVDPGRGVARGGCASCSGIPYDADHFHVTFAVPPERVESLARRLELWEHLAYAEVLDDAQVVGRNVLGLEILREGRRPSYFDLHFVGRLLDETMAVIRAWPPEDRHRVAEEVAFIRQSADDIFSRNTLAALGRSLEQ